MMGTRAKLRGGSEYDAFSRAARKLYCYLQRSKVVRKIKRGFWKRQRNETRMKLKDAEQ